MAVTFTAKAACEMRGRLRALGVSGVSARTFHAAALAQVNFFWPTLAGDQAPSIIDNKVRMLAAHAADGVGLSPDTATLRDVAAAIEWRKVTLRSIDQYAADRPEGSAVWASTRSSPFSARTRSSRTSAADGLRDVLLTCAGMIEAEPHVAAAVREQYRHFTVDEYQDVSPLQNRVLELWLGDRRDLCVVGDASQTVYSFTGADARYLLDFGRTHEDARVVRLERNYRSTAPVLAVANELMRGRAGALELVAASAVDTPTPTVRAFRRRRGRGHRGGEVDRRLPDTRSRPARHRCAVPRPRAVGGAARRVVAGRRGGIGAGRAQVLRSAEVRQALMALRAASVAPMETGFPRHGGATCCAASDSPTTRRRPAARCARRGKRGRPCCVWPRTRRREPTCARSPTTCRHARAISTSRRRAR